MKPQPSLPPRPAAPTKPSREQLPPVAEAPGKSFIDLLFPKRRFRQHRPKSFRTFWGAVLDGNPALRSIADRRNVSMTRKEFKLALQEAFYAGQGMTAGEAAKKMGTSK